MHRRFFKIKKLEKDLAIEDSNGRDRSEAEVSILNVAAEIEALDSPKSRLEEMLIHAGRNIWELDTKLRDILAEQEIRTLTYGDAEKVLQDQKVNGIYSRYTSKQKRKIEKLLGTIKHTKAELEEDIEIFTKDNFGRALYERIKPYLATAEQNNKDIFDSQKRKEMIEPVAQKEQVLSLKKRQIVLLRQQENAGVRALDSMRVLAKTLENISGKQDQLTAAELDFVQLEEKKLVGLLDEIDQTEQAIFSLESDQKYTMGELTLEEALQEQSDFLQVIAQSREARIESRQMYLKNKVPLYNPQTEQELLAKVQNLQHKTKVLDEKIDELDRELSTMTDNLSLKKKLWGRLESEEAAIPIYLELLVSKRNELQERRRFDEADELTQIISDLSDRKKLIDSINRRNERMRELEPQNERLTIFAQKTSFNTKIA